MSKYDPMAEHGNADYRSWMRLNDVQIAALSGAEGNDNAILSARQYAQMVYMVNPGGTITVSGAVDVDPQDISDGVAAGLSAMPLNIDPQDIADGIIIANATGYEDSYQLTASGTASDPTIVSGSLHHTYQIKVSLVGSPPPIFQVEGSLDANDWFNLDANSETTSAVGNEILGFVFQGKIKYTRVNYLSGAGQLDIKYLGGN